MIRLNHLPAEHGWLQRIDPRVKLGLAAGLLIIALLYRDSLFLFGLLLVELLLAISSRLPMKRLVIGLLALLPVSLLMFALRWIFYPQGEVLATLGPITLTLGGLAAGAAVALRILALATAVLLWLETTDNQDIIRSLVALGLPYDWGLSFALALRFLPDFFQTYRSIEEAQRARGLDLTQASLIQQVRGRQPIIIAMLISSLRRSERLAVALEARAFGSDPKKRTQYQPLAMTPKDWLILSVLLVAFALLIALYFLAGPASQSL